MRILGADVPDAKRVEIGLTYIFGIGLTSSQKTLAATGVSPDIRVKDLSEAQTIAIRDFIQNNFKIEGDLKREVTQDIRLKQEIGSYQGLRHKRGLPVHGQRTKTNARTRKGPRKAVAGKKKANDKT